MTVGIIGGGAAGLIAAVTAARQGAEVLLFESKPRVGKKLSATGNGRCNITNLQAAPKRYYSVQSKGTAKNSAFIARVLQTVTPADTLALFRELGLRTFCEAEGRVYPCSSMAGSVVDVLRFGVEAAGVTVYTDTEIVSARREKSGFRLQSANETFFCQRLIIACGGKASPQLGGTDGGYKLLKALGHSVTPLKAALVPLLTANNATRALKGIRAEAAIEVVAEGKTLATTEGEVQFTEDGLSGIPIFNIARMAADGKYTEIRLDFAPEETVASLTEMLSKRVNGCPALTAGDLCTGLVQNRLGKVIVKAAGIGCETPLADLNNTHIQAVAEKIKNFAFPILREAGFDRAQVTAGGAYLTEFDPATMGSLITDGLYAAGEVLDCHGDCGGFNLQWAWSTGIMAGRSAAKEER